MMLQHWLIAPDILRQSSVLISFNLWRWGHYVGLKWQDPIIQWWHLMSQKNRILFISSGIVEK